VTDAGVAWMGLGGWWHARQRAHLQARQGWPDAQDMREGVHRGTGRPRGVVGTDAGSGADCVLYPAGVVSCDREPWRQARSEGGVLLEA
jgi:hypothetical protein